MNDKNKRTRKAYEVRKMTWNYTTNESIILSLARNIARQLVIEWVVMLTVFCVCPEL